MSGSKQEQVKLDNVIIHHRSNQAILISIEEDSFGAEAERIWLPLSEITITSYPDYKTGNTVTDIELPEWLAIEKGLV